VTNIYGAFRPAQTNGTKEAISKVTVYTSQATFLPFDWPQILHADNDMIDMNQQVYYQ